MTVSSVGGSPLLKLLEMLKTLDRDGDGAISRTEFVEGRPAGLSSDQASGLYDAMTSAQPTSGDSATGLSANDLVTAFQQLDPQMQSSLIQAQGESDRLFSQIAHNLKDAVIAYLKDEKEKEVWTVKTEKVNADTAEQTPG